MGWPVGQRARGLTGRANKFNPFSLAGWAGLTRLWRAKNGPGQNGPGRPVLTTLAVPVGKPIKHVGFKSSLFRLVACMIYCQWFLKHDNTIFFFLHVTLKHLPFFIFV